MILALLMIAVVAGAHLVMLWKAERERSARWTLYALRDRLRWEAIQDRAILESPLFERVDIALTTLAGNLRDISLWTLLPYGLVRRETHSEERAVWACMSKPEYAPIAAVAAEAAKVFANHLACRHVFLAGLVVLTVVGYTKGRDLVAGLSRAVVMNVIQPAVPRPTLGHVLTRRSA